MAKEVLRKDAADPRINGLKLLARMIAGAYLRQTSQASTFCSTEDKKQEEGEHGDKGYA